MGDGDKRHLGKDESLTWWRNPNDNPGKTTLGEDERLMWFLEPPIELSKEERIRLMIEKRKREEIVKNVQTTHYTD